ncbi:DUF547 domain-containing protein [Muriicola sp. Z0-33]|uniref:DUF547 domain-containing protein n=1 Tax=Muriicola sp. Z0-33 TaxID=2816957 RepID=UPI002237BC68|nr:DUF547 domain-containing protein [Muriicola sp. Z0-33]MCW5515111.1 DUF547 domain-containing protein [Muriicola sp. Z0-33]
MKRKIILLSSLFLLAGSLSFGQDTTQFFEKSASFFETYVKDGKVAYNEIKSNPGLLNELLKMATSINVTTENPEEYQAFWINGYNLLVIKGIVANYPVKSPLDIDGFFDKDKHAIGGMDISLNDIENQLLRAKFPSEARFHFVLVCAGLGCPPIIDMAYLPSTLNGQLQRQTILSLNNPDFIQLNKNKIKVSQIFQWYKEDFTRENKTLIDFINGYRESKIPTNYRVGYYSYDWTLNDLK